MEGKSTPLRLAFVEAYPRYVAAVLVDRGVEVDDVIADAIVEGASVLDGLLGNLESTLPIRQRQSPLELFREALRPVGRALDTVGAQPPESDTGSVSFVQWDTHMLSPASSAVLGQVAHEAHLRWGVAKAQAMGALSKEVRRPSVAVLCGADDRGAIEQQSVSAGYVVADRVEDAMFAIVDVDIGSSQRTLARVLQSGVKTIVYGSAIDEFHRAALHAQGVWQIISRDVAIVDLRSVLPFLV